ncbi:N-acetylglucosamine kinase [Bombilactobacillus folatiphilus]|uniref:N-acetylglucosamine kinase n=1 Tax=Bombilactobacillus folatiphilus TaxID=2923362 RepID=A0ABY4P8N6_9LACO|nr:BadF/BadG/BcrA/BcrD ATPase family protein [Bombilactobacillus folatiphilus]UQS82085.1 N-acetylglucosamine kinase [Bombilactobacillus folatiphilus]
MSYLIGIDCGGTHIMGQLWQTQPEKLLTEVPGEPGNLTLNYDTAVANLEHVLDELLSTCPAAPEQILIGLAGLEASGQATKLQKQLVAQYHLPIQLVSDAKLALLNGLQGQDGMLIIAGTGSVIYARQQGHFFRNGGWGYILGDEGSAFDIAKTALQQVLKAYDNDTLSSLTQPLLTKLQATDIQDAVHTFYNQDRTQNAQLAMTVANLAQQNNPEAQYIIELCAKKLSQQALNLLHHHQMTLPTKIVLSGSVLLNNQAFQTALKQSIQSQISAIDFLPVSHNNAHGVLYWHYWQ